MYGRPVGFSAKVRARELVKSVRKVRGRQVQFSDQDGDLSPWMGGQPVHQNPGGPAIPFTQVCRPMGSKEGARPIEGQELDLSGSGQLKKGGVVFPREAPGFVVADFFVETLQAQLPCLESIE